MRKFLSSLFSPKRNKSRKRKKSKLKNTFKEIREKAGERYKTSEIDVTKPHL